MADSPAVSIITPTFNHERFIQECIRSVLRQTFDNWEMVVVDDGSTDSTAERVLAFGDPRIKMIRQANKGISRLAETYNTGLAASSAEVIAILEGDDYWPVDKLEIQVPDFGDSDVILSAGRFLIVSSEGAPRLVTPEGLPPDAALSNTPIGRATAAMMSHKILTFTFPVTALIRKTALERIGGFQQPDYLPLVDFPTFLRLTLEGKWSFHDHLLGFWRRHDSSTTLSRFPWILSGVHRHCAEFCRENREMAGISREEALGLEDDWRHFQMERAALLGRWLSSEGRWREARSMFRQCLRLAVRRNTKMMMRTAARLAALRRSPEIAFRLGRRTHWQDSMTLRTGDKLVSTEMVPEDFQAYSFLE